MKAWSHYQEAIFAAAEDATKGSIVVVARAGSGKTTTLIEMASRVPPRGRQAIVAFANRSRQRVEDAKPPSHFEVSTLHSMGLGMLRRHNPRLQVDNQGTKLRAIVDGEAQGASFAVRQAALSLAKHAKTQRVDTKTELRLLALENEENDFTDRELDELVELVLRSLFMCREQDELVDFDDMIWLPVELGLSEARYRWLLVDELQDMTPAQVELVASASRGGRVVGFGDDRQAIYQFAGASSDALAILGRLSRAERLPLSISYRCARAIVREAQQFVPDIEPHEGAPDGRVVRSSRIHFAKPGDLILSRTNAPLLRLCLQFVQRSVPAYIAGRPHADAMIKLLERSKANSVTEFFRWLDAWSKREAGKLETVGKEIDRVTDRVECFRVLADGCPSIRAMQARIETLFSETRGQAVVLSTIHQMKGDEADRVFVLTDSFRLKLETFLASPEEHEGTEEANLWYVALTRARRELHYVSGVR